MLQLRCSLFVLLLLLLGRGGWAQDIDPTGANQFVLTPPAGWSARVESGVTTYTNPEDNAALMVSVVTAEMPLVPEIKEAFRKGQTDQGLTVTGTADVTLQGKPAWRCDVSIGNGFQGYHLVVPDRGHGRSVIFTFRSPSASFSANRDRVEEAIGTLQLK